MVCLITLVTEQNEFPMMKHGNKVYIRAVTQDEPLSEVVASTVNKMVELTSRSDDHELAVLFEYLAVNNSNSAASMAFNIRGTHQNVLGICVWHENASEDQATGRELCHALTDVVAYSQSDAAVSLNRSYGNHGAKYLCLLQVFCFKRLIHCISTESDEMSSSERSTKLFGSNYPRLQQLKKEYDPDFMFNKWMPITPA